MFRQRSFRAFAWLAAVLLAAGAALLLQAPAPAQQGEPIKIGFGMAQTGPLAPNGKSALLAAAKERALHRGITVVSTTGALSLS